jgi:hypothetical protein
MEGFNPPSPEDNPEYYDGIEDIPNFQASLNLGPRDSLRHMMGAIGALCHPVTDLIYPGWREDFILGLVKTNELNQAMGVNRHPGAELIHMAVTAITLSARFQMALREREGVVIDDDCEAYTDPATVLERLAEGLVTDEELDAGLARVMEQTKHLPIVVDPNASVVKGPDEPKISPEDASSLEDLFNLPSPDETQDND